MTVPQLAFLAKTIVVVGMGGLSPSMGVGRSPMPKSVWVTLQIKGTDRNHNILKRSSY